MEERSEVGTAAELLSKLRELHIRSGRPSLSELVKLTNEVQRPMTRSTIQDKLRGTSKPTLDQLMTIVRACHRRAAMTKTPLPDDLVNEERWRQWWFTTNQQHTQLFGAAISKEAAPTSDQEYTHPRESASLKEDSNQIHARSANTFDLPPKAEKTLSEAFRAHITSIRQRDLALFRDVSVAPTAGGVQAAIDRAYELGLIPDQGCRVPLDNTYLYLRFTPSSNPDQWKDAPPIRLEEKSLNTLSYIEWTTSETALDFLVKVTERAQSLGFHPGDRRFDPTQSLDDLRQLLEVAYDRSIAEESTRSRVVGIIELYPPQWAVTENGVACIDGHHRAYVRNENLDNSEVVGRISQHDWVDQPKFEAALTTAQIFATHKRQAVPWEDPPF